MHLTTLARAHPDKPAVVLGKGKLTYRMLEERSNRIARLFRGRGLRPGDHIAVLMENQLDLFPVVRSGPGCSTRRSTGT